MGAAVATIKPAILLLLLLVLFPLPMFLASGCSDG
jgi:hypothetical protein